MRQIDPKSDYVVASLTDYGDSRKRRCIFCKKAVFPLDKTISYAAKRFKTAKRKRYICFLCFTARFDQKKHVLIPTPDAKKMLGMSTSEVRKLTCVLVEAEKENRRDDSLAG